LEDPAVAEPFSFDLHMADYGIFAATTKYRVRAGAVFWAVLLHCNILLSWLLQRTIKILTSHYQEFRK